MAIFGKPDSKPPEPAPAPRSGGPAPAPPAAPARAGASHFGSKTVVKGEITGDEDVVVEGRVEGQIRISKELRVGPGGSVVASVEAQTILIAGEVVGNCLAASRVEIQPSGRLTGDIRAPRVVIAEGAQFRGNSDMGGREGKGRGPA